MARQGALFTLIQTLPRLVVMFYLTDGPEKAHWLAVDERDWLIDRLRRERMVREARGRHSLWEALKHPRVLVLGLVYFGTAAAGYRLGFWLPTIVKEFGVTDLQPGSSPRYPTLSASPPL